MQVCMFVSNYKSTFKYRPCFSFPFKSSSEIINEIHTYSNIYFALKRVILFAFLHTRWLLVADSFNAVLQPLTFEGLEVILW